MGKTNFEKVIEGIGNFFKTVEKNQREQFKEQLAATDQSVVEVCLITKCYDQTKKDIKAEVEEFFKKAPLPFVDIYDIEFFESSTLKQYFVLVTFSVLVAAAPKEAKEEMEFRCHKVVESQNDVIAFRVKVDKSFR